MKLIIAFCLIVFSSACYAQDQQQPLPKEIRSAALIKLPSEAPPQHSTAFMKRQRTANIIYAIAAVLTIVGVANYEDTAPAYYYAPTAFWVVGFAVDRSAYYLD